MIDTNKYEGHTPGPWMWYRDDGDVDLVVANDQCHTIMEEVKALYSEANENLIADAPLLLEEVKRLQITVDAQSVIVHDYNEQQSELKRLRGLLIKGSEDYTTSYMDLRKVIEDVHWELTGDDHETNEERIKHALIALSEVIIKHALIALSEVIE